MRERGMFLMLSVAPRTGGLVDDVVRAPTVRAIKTDIPAGVGNGEVDCG